MELQMEDDQHVGEIILTDEEQEVEPCLGLYVIRCVNSETQTGEQVSQYLDLDVGFVSVVQSHWSAVHRLLHQRQ